MTTGSAIPVFSQASSSASPSWARKALLPSFASARNWMYSQLVGWYIRSIVAEAAPAGSVT